MTISATCAIGEASRSPSYYRAEQYDSDLGLYYLRARYYDPATGRFMGRDPENGDTLIPATLHKYLYANGDPVNLKDPTGREVMVGTAELILEDVKLAAALIAVGALIDCQYYKAAELLSGIVRVAISGETLESITYGFCSAKVKGKRNRNCTAQDVATCQTLYPNCRGSQCGNCLSYCLTQCEWPFHKPECNNLKFPKPWTDFPPPSGWIN